MSNPPQCVIENVFMHGDSVMRLSDDLDEVVSNDEVNTARTGFLHRKG